MRSLEDLKVGDEKKEVSSLEREGWQNVVIKQEN